MVHDQNWPARDPSTHIQYAIHSARAVVAALMARDQDAAEKAALRTCHNCDLLVRLLRDVASLLGDPRNQQLGLGPMETFVLARRANNVLAIVEASAPNEHSTALSCRNLDSTPVELCKSCIPCSGEPETGDRPHTSPQAPQAPTVASTGLRVRLVPCEGENGSASPAEGKPNSSSPRSDDPPSGCAER